LKKNKIFELPFIDVEKEGDFSILYHEKGHYTTIFKIENLVETYSGDKNLYVKYHHVINNIVKLLGQNYTIQKQDIFSTVTYKGKKSNDFLTEKYFEHFKGRSYKKITTTLAITKNAKKGSFYQYNQNDFIEFKNKITKTFDLLYEYDFLPKYLSPSEVRDLLKRFASFSFDGNNIVYDNIKSDADSLEFKGKKLKTISFIDIDEINLPGNIKPYYNKNLGYEFPVDYCSFINDIPNVETIVYNQVIKVNSQKVEMFSLEKKRKRHDSMPDPANELAVKDIDDVFANIAKTNDLLVNSHFSLMLYGDKEAVESSTNYVETSLFNLGIIPSDNSYNQYELFLCSIPGNAVELKEYDLFKTTLDPALCLFFKEKYFVGDDSNFQIYFADRRGIPVPIDTSDLPMQTNRINNRNKFVLGPSGSGKSFYMNHLVRQYYTYDTDVILVDTGHSYSGVCKYFNGKYITYSEKNPITMNPFKINRDEYNEEKRQNLKSLIVLLWKGGDDTANQTEDTALINCIFAYYTEYFKSEKDISYLSFNSFYEFSIVKLKEMIESESIPFDLQGYKFILKKFYKGGEYDTILNSDVDTSLFDEKFIVFEIDSIKEHKILFPITTIIIMDVFIQKMRLKGSRKALIIEEAWKAIASPNMANYILYVYKTVRKFRGEAVVVTQELEDIISNDILKNSIINNSDTIVLLDQSKFRDNYDVVSDLLSLNEVEKNKIFTINKLDNKESRSRFKEVYKKRGETGEVLGVEVSIYEYLTYTTERTEKDAVEAYLSYHNNDYRKGLESFVKDLEDSKLSIPAFCDKVNQRSKDLISIN